MPPRVRRQSGRTSSTVQSLHLEGYKANVYSRSITSAPPTSLSPPKKNKLGFARIARVDLESPREQLLQMLQCSNCSCATDDNNNDDDDDCCASSRYVIGVWRPKYRTCRRWTSKPASVELATSTGFLDGRFRSPSSSSTSSTGSRTPFRRQTAPTCPTNYDNRFFIAAALQTHGADLFPRWGPSLPSSCPSSLSLSSPLFLPLPLPHSHFPFVLHFSHSLFPPLSSLNISVKLPSMHRQRILCSY